MVDVQTAIAIVFILALSALIYAKRSKFQFSGSFPFLYVGMLRTTWGLKSMDWLGTKLRKPIQWLAYVGIVIGFIGMAFIVVSLVKSTIALFITPELAPGIQPVLPFEAKGVFFVPFIYWIVSIFVIAAVHEFAHGVVARAHNVKVKSSGFAFLGLILPLIPAAFVEPDEKQLTKRPAREQWSVFAAGPFANIILSILIIFAFGLDASPAFPHAITGKTAIVDFTELGQDLHVLTGLEITKVEPNSPAASSGLKVGDVVTAVNGVSVSNRESIAKLVEELKPGQTVTLTAGATTYSLVLGSHPQDAARGYIGITFDLQTAPAPAAIARYGATGVSVISFLMSLIVWIFILSLGIGLFNLIPLGPIDGGRMFKLAAEKIIGTRGTQLWKLVSYAILGMIFINLFIGFFR
ncbi:MAG TPA: site-2 protease family protein [Candidatus Binatia bacterium]|nr:site-2 protease family protein [Candidatus Binatia bacterium]